MNTGKGYPLVLLKYSMSDNRIFNPNKRKAPPKMISAKLLFFFVSKSRKRKTASKIPIAKMKYTGFNIFIITNIVFLIEMTLESKGKHFLHHSKI